MVINVDGVFVWGGRLEGCEEIYFKYHWKGSRSNFMAYIKLLWQPKTLNKYFFSREMGKGGGGGEGGGLFII